MNERICKCYDLPAKGRFLVGNQYLYEYTIDAIVVKDEDGASISFHEIKWLWYFHKME